MSSTAITCPDCTDGVAPYSKGRFMWERNGHLLACATCEGTGKRSAPYYVGHGVTIYNADCRDVELPSKSVDLLATDPPYGIAHKSRGRHEPIAGDADNGWVQDALRHCLRALRINRHFYVFGPDVVSDLTVCPTVELIWDKGRMSAGGNMETPWSPGHERITFGMYSPYKSHKNVGAGAVRMRRSSVIKVPKQNNGRGSFTHPNEKPVELMRVIIECSSQFDEVVFDPFMGSGTTLVAAMLEGRQAVGIEVDERYCEVAAERIESLASNGSSSKGQQ